MDFEVFRNEKPSLKVAFFHRRSFGTTLTQDDNIKQFCDYNNLEIHLFSTDNNNFLNFETYEKHKKIGELPEVQIIYDFIAAYIKKENIGVCIFFGSGYPWSEAFLNKIKEQSYIACYFGDDPEGAEYTSRYYVKNYHYAFCGGVFFDAVTRIKDKYVEWGARKSKFIPLGVNPTKYRELAGDEQRKIEVVYVGGAYLKKILKIFRLKRHFGDRMKLYGRGWNGMSDNKIRITIFRFIKWLYKVPFIEELPENKLVELYRQSKIGFNMHMSYGPSNLRLYELPINEVMQICDCENGLGELYEIDKEVVTYKNINEAIKKIEYYLVHDEERKKIAMAGCERAKNNYKLEITFGHLMDEITHDIKENFKQYIKSNE